MNIIENLTPVNHDSGRAGHSITGIVLHTMVGSTDSAQSRFFNGNAQVSANYGISLNGEIRLWVRESDTAWCNGNYQSNLTTISIEHEDQGDYNGPRTPQLYQASAELVASLCRRYGIPCDRAHIKGHNEVIDKSRYPGGTACPDGLDMNRIIAEANSILNPSNPAVVPITPSATGETVFLPADNTSWRLYPTDKLPVVGNEKAKLAPAQFGGLTYAVLGHPYPNVVTIQTQMFGIGNIWVGPDTNARITAAPAPPPIAPAITTAVPDKAPTVAKSTYIRLEKPLKLKANKQPTNIYNLDGGSWSVLNKAIVGTKNKDDDFEAVGRAKHPLGSFYYMDAESFGNADTTGIPSKNQGVNTVDLTLPVEVPATPAPAEQAAPAEPITNAPENTSVPAATEEKVPVTVIQTDWKKIDTSFAGEYEANTSLHVYDLDGSGAPEQLAKGQLVHVGGKFVKDKIKYYITEKKIAAGLMYGIPEIALKELHLKSDGDVFTETFIKEARAGLGKLSNREKAIAAAATASSKKLRISDLFHKKKK